MPNRILKESIRTSKNINALTDFQFRIWTYLITYVDDFGRGSADPELLKGMVFTRRKGVTESQIAKALKELANMGMVILYECDGEPFFYFPNWGKHQTIRNKRSKFPDPDTCRKLESNCMQVESDCEANVTVIQSESRIRIQNPNPNFCTEQTDVGSMPVIELPLNDGSMFDVPQNKYNEWLSLYPAVDVMQELRKMRGWLDGNPKKRKTKGGIMRFINGWLSRAQDSPHIDKRTKRENSSFDIDEYIRQLEEEERNAKVGNSQGVEAP